MDPYGTPPGTGSNLGHEANVHPRNLASELSGLDHSPARGRNGSHSSETLGGLGGLLHAAKMLGPDPPEEPNDEPTSDFGVADSALTTMLGSTDEGSTRSSDSETSGKHGFATRLPGRDRKRRLCAADGCETRPSFAKAGEPPVRCKLHKAEGDINVKNPICIVQDCTSRSRFGMQGSKPLHCKDHRQPGEINPFRPPCVYPGCVVTPTYAEEGRKPARCAKHKNPNDINTNRQRCGEKNCRERPCFVNYVTGVKHCLNHFSSGDTGGLRGMCQARDPGSEAPCRKYATFSTIQGKPLRCKDHKLADDVDVLNKMCENADCFKRPSFAPAGEASKRCKSHALSGDVNVNGKRCLAVGCKTFVAVKKKTCKAHAHYLD